jgi:hypothetical protein
MSGRGLTVKSCESERLRSNGAARGPLNRGPAQRAVFRLRNDRPRAPVRWYGTRPAGDRRLTVNGRLALERMVASTFGRSPRAPRLKPGRRQGCAGANSSQMIGAK